MSGLIEDLKKDKKELDIKICHLVLLMRYMDNTSTKHYHVLTLQLTAMLRYRSALEQRINLLLSH